MSPPDQLSGSGYAPGHITGFFTIFKAADPILSGSTGAGVCIDGGVRTEVTVSPSAEPKFDLTYNGKSLRSPTCEYVASRLAPQSGAYAISAKQESILPSNYGYGISGASALSLALSLNEAFGLKLTIRELGAIAHVAEVTNLTGLGDVIAEMAGGLEVRISPGGPGFGVAKQLPLGGDFVVLSTPVAEFRTAEMLTGERYVERINRLGRRALESFLERPNVDRFMEESRKFWEGVGLFDGTIRSVLHKYEEAGVANPSAKKGAVFAIVERTDLPRLVSRLTGSPSCPPSGPVLRMEGGLKLIVSEIHRSGMRWE